MSLPAPNRIALSLVERSTPERALAVAVEPTTYQQITHHHAAA